MAKKKNGKINREAEQKNNVDIGHIIKLLSRAALELSRTYVPADIRKAILDYANQMQLSVAEMEKQDWEHIENTPELKIEKLRKEIINNDEILKKNKESFREQIQQGLYRMGMPVGTPWADSLIEHLKLSIEEVQIKLNTNFEIMQPTFAFQLMPRWIEIQKILHEKNLKAMQDNLDEVQKKIEMITQEINEQNERIIARRAQILEELTALGADISQYTKQPPQDYIN